MNIEDADEVRVLVEHMRGLESARRETNEIRYLTMAEGSDREDSETGLGCFRHIKLVTFLNEGSSLPVEAATALRKVIVDGIDKRHEEVVSRLKELGVTF